MREDFHLRPLAPEDASDVLALLHAQPAEYVRFFRPFPFERDAISELLSKQERDVYSGVYWRHHLVGFFTLRGWDEGYAEPAFGVVIEGKFRGTGLDMIALDSAKLICRLRGAPGMITKVHPENMSAKGVMRKIGFTLIGPERSGGNFIYRLEIGPERGANQNQSTP